MVAFRKLLFHGTEYFQGLGAVKRLKTCSIQRVLTPGIDSPELFACIGQIKLSTGR